MQAFGSCGWQLDCCRKNTNTTYKITQPVHIVLSCTTGDPSLVQIPNFPFLDHWTL